MFLLTIGVVFAIFASFGPYDVLCNLIATNFLS